MTPVNKPVTVARPASQNEPDTIASSFLAEHFTLAKHSTIHRYRNQFWCYENTHYAVADENALRSRFHSHFVQEVKKTNLVIRNRGLENAAWEAFKDTIYLDSNKREIPSWLTPETINTKADYDHITFQNGILSLKDRQLKDHSPRWFSPTCLPFNYDSDAEAPNWLNFLEDVFEGDDERVALLQEWFGYCFTPDTSRHKFMLFEGESRAGKGTIMNTLVNLIGETNISTVRLEMFGERFHLFQTYGKLLNVIDEADHIEQFAEGIFKTFVAGGLVPFESKGKNTFSSRATARVLILVNEKPQIRDKSEGLWNRMLLLSFRRSFAGKENYKLDMIFKNELPGIFNWALQGVERLTRQDTFTEPRMSVQEKEQYKLDSNPARQWLLENCTKRNPALDPHEDMLSKALYQRYAQFCSESGLHKLSIIRFNKEVKKVFPQASQAKMRVLEERHYWWSGIEPLV